MPSELKPCPFCGGQKITPFTGDGAEGVGRCAAFCDCCNTEGPHCTTEAEAIAAWNTRPQPPAPQDDGIIIDLEKGFFETLMTAANQSNWMPPEYYMNDWVSDCCKFLETGEGINQPPAPQDDLVEELPQPLKDLLHHIVQCMVAEGCGEISAWESIKTIWPAITDYFVLIIAERDALRAKLAAAEAHLRQAADNLESGAKLYDCPGLEAAAKLARAAERPDAMIAANKEGEKP